MRVFFAIDLPEPIKNTIANVISVLKTTYHNDTLRWVNPQNMHLTLGFLENILAEDVNKLIAKTKTYLTQLRQFELQLTGLELFPNPERPKLISISVSPHEAISELAHCIKQSIEAIGYPTEKRQFRGHITLGRFNYWIKDEELFLADVKTPDVDKFWVNEVVLFQSRPSDAEFRYYELEKISLLS